MRMREVPFVDHRLNPPVSESELRCGHNHHCSLFPCPCISGNMGGHLSGFRWLLGAYSSVVGVGQGSFRVTGNRSGMLPSAA
jgi:hypothetical protein